MLFEENRRQVPANSPRIGINRVAEHDHADVVCQVTSNCRWKKINTTGCRIHRPIEFLQDYPTKSVTIDIWRKHCIYRIFREQFFAVQSAIPAVDIVHRGVQPAPAVRSSRLKIARRYRTGFSQIYGNYLFSVVMSRLAHSRRNENVILQILEIWLARDFFDHGSQNRIARISISESLARLELQRSLCEIY